MGKLHEELKKRACCWLEERGYSVQEEVNIGSRRVDVLGTKSDPPENIVGIECGKITNKTPPPENIVILHWPYESSEPYRWEPSASLKPSASSRKASTSSPDADARQVYFHQRKRIIKIGERSGGIILPQEWLEFHGLKRGDEIALLGNALIVIAPKHMERKARHIIDEEERK